MSLLSDTHVVLWWLIDDPTLSDDIKIRLDFEPDIYVSAATVWEIAIKQATGKPPEPPMLPELIRESGFTALPVSYRTAPVPYVPISKEILLRRLPEFPAAI